LHAQVQREMEALETAEQFRQRQENPQALPKMTRQIAVDLVSQMWRSMNHQQVREKGCFLR